MFGHARVSTDCQSVDAHRKPKLTLHQRREARKRRDRIQFIVIPEA